MKSKLPLMLVMMTLLVVPLFTDTYERVNFAAFLDAGIPIKVEESDYTDFGRSLVGLALQARLSGIFHAEFSFAYYPAPRPDSKFADHDYGLEVTLGGLWKFSPRKDIHPFVKLGLSYAEISYKKFGPDNFWGLNTGAGIECQLNKELLFRLGGACTLVPIFFESARTWGKIFASLGLRL